MSATQKSNPSCTVTSKAADGSRTSCNRGVVGLASGDDGSGTPGSAAAVASSTWATSRLASPVVEPAWSATMTAPSMRRSPDQAIGNIVATVAVWGRSAATIPAANVTVAVAAGTTSRIATQSVSPVSPSKGLATNGAGPADRSLVRFSRTCVLSAVRRLDALPMEANPSVPGPVRRDADQGKLRRDGPPSETQTVQEPTSSLTPHSWARLRTIRSPRPELAKSVGRNGAGRVRPPPSVTSISTTPSSGEPVQPHGAVRQRRGVPHRVADQLRDHALGLLDHQPRDPAGGQVGHELAAREGHGASAIRQPHRALVSRAAVPWHQTSPRDPTPVGSTSPARLVAGHGPGAPRGGATSLMAYAGRGARARGGAGW